VTRGARPGDGTRMAPDRTTKRQRPPEQLGSPVTAVDDLYVIGHFGIAHVPADTWTLRVGGDVERPLELGLDELRALPSVEVHAVLECFGNPLRPAEPTRRVGNVVWRGTPVDVVLRLAGAHDTALLWAEGRDSGVFEGTPCSEYLKDLPLDVVRERGILAHEMNGEPLRVEHGYPVRLFVPGYFGTNNVKWLRALTVAGHRPRHLFTTTLYQRPSAATGELAPVRSLDVNSIVTRVDRDDGALRVSGWAWGSSEVVEVDVGTARRATPHEVDAWVDAELAPAVGGPYAWRGFSATLPGEDVGVVLARARDRTGACQPVSGARNACHAVTVDAAS
jgi:sulfane dehydrogenase subunit SoxC